jgi:8-amino-7-oxononanoate synthase
MPDPLAWIDDESAAWAQRGLRRALLAVGPARDGMVERAGRSLVHFGSNDYLGLGSDPRVVEAAVEAARAFGWGAGASPLVAGWREPHQDLAEALARFEGTEAALVFPTGYAALAGTVAALVGPGDAVFSDQLNHASLIDGARLSRAQVRVYAHGDAAALEALLAADRGQSTRRLILTESLFGMDGDLAPLPALQDLADRFGAMLLVDEAHATGVLGPDGRGGAAACGIAERVSVRVGTLSKALGSAGGFVAGQRRLIDWLANHARPLIFSTSLPPATAAAARRALELVASEPWRRAHLLALADRLRDRLRAAGYVTGRSAGPIAPVIVGTPERALELGERLMDRGFFVPAIRPPSVPAGTARLRISLTASHTAAQVDDLARALAAD